MLDPKDEIKQRLDVGEVIGRYLQLKPAGSGSFKTCCPFHAEKTPSFYVSIEKQIWHCFGCSKGGDLFSFLMEIEGIDFPRALEIAAQFAGVKLPERVIEPDKQEKEILFELHVVAQKLFTKILKDHERAKDAREYLKKRGITDELIDSFELGFAPEEWRMLTDFLRKRNYKDSDLIKSGLAKQTQAGDDLIDRFRNRILIPLFDAQGRIVGFTGRSLVETDKSGPKYLNSPETLIYNKRSILYGLHLAKAEIRRTKSVIIVEGNLDVIASHKAGVKQIVASSGTALTEIQLSILKKLTNTLIFCFDEDSAGYEAAKRGMDLAQSMGFDLRVIRITKDLGKDPDDVVQKDPLLWKALVEKPIHVMQYYFDKEFEKANMIDVSQKKQVTELLLSKIGLYTNAIEREHWLMHLADRTRLSIEMLRSQLSQVAKKELDLPKIQQNNGKPPTYSKIDRSIEFLLGLIIEDVAYISLLDQINEQIIQNENLKRIAKKVKLLYTSGEFAIDTPKPLFSILRERYSQEGQSDDINFIDTLLLQTERLKQEINEKQLREEIDSHLQILKEVPHKQSLLELERNIRQAELSGDKELARRLTDQYAQALQSLIHDH